MATASSRQVVVNSIAGTTLLGLSDVDDVCSIGELKAKVVEKFIAQGKLARVDLVLEGQVLSDEQLCGATLPMGATVLQAVSAAYTPAELERLLENHDGSTDEQLYVARYVLASGDYKLRSIALRALVRISGRSVCPEVRAALRSGTPEAREVFVSELGRLGSAAEAYVADISALLNDSSLQVCRSSAIALGKIGKAAAPILAKTLRSHRDQEVRRHAARALGSLGEAAVPHIKNMICKGMTQETCKLALDSTSLLGAAAVGLTSDLVALIREPSIKGRVESILTGIRGRAQMDVSSRVVAMLSDPDGCLRACAVDAVLMLGLQSSNGAKLVSMLRDPDKDVRRRAVQAVKSIGAPAISHVVPMLRDADSDIRLSASDVMRAHSLSGGQLSSAHVGELAKLLRDSDTRVIRHAAVALRHAGSNATCYSAEIAGILDAGSKEENGVAGALRQLEFLHQSEPLAMEAPVPVGRCRHSTLRNMRRGSAMQAVAGVITQPAPARKQSGRGAELGILPSSP